MAFSEFAIAIRFKLLSIFDKGREHESIKNEPIDINQHTITSAPPPCITLSSNKQSNMSFPDPTRVPTMEEIEDVTQEYCEILHSSPPLESDFVNDTFTHKSTGVKFCITRLETPGNKKNVIYLAGNNDYFYNKEYAEMYRDAGYNLYAICFPNFGFVSDVKHPKYSTFANVSELYKYIDFACSHYGYNGVDVLTGHSTGGLIGISYTWYKNHAIPTTDPMFVRKVILSSPLIDWYGRPEWWDSSAFLESELFMDILSSVGSLLPANIVNNINVKSNTGVPSVVTSGEYGITPFNPNYKSLLEIPTYFGWIIECSREMTYIQRGERNCKCPVTILCSDKSVFWEYTSTADNTLDVADYDKYGTQLGDDVVVSKIPDAVHSVFLSVDMSTFASTYL